MRRLMGLVVALAFAAGSLPAQSLGELAAKEKRRREEEQKKNKGPARVITTEDLAKVTASTATAAAPALAQDLGARRARSEAAAETESSESEGGASGPGGRDEKTWRAQAAEAREAVRGAEQTAQSLERQIAKLFGEIQRSTDTNEILRLRAEQKDLEEELERTKQELAKARQELVAFEESARRAGVPPGWIR